MYVFICLDLSVIQKKNQDLKTEELQFLTINSGQSYMLYKVSFGKEQQEGEVQICVI